MSSRVDQCASDLELVRPPAPRGPTAALTARVRRSESDLVGQGLRFGLAGATVAAVYTLTTTLLAVVIGLPFQVALALGFCLALTVHFTLQRTFVWVHHNEFALGLRDQIPRYLCVASVQYGLTAASSALLPSLLGLPTEAVYLVTVVLITAGNFFIFRHGIFHATPT